MTWLRRNAETIEAVAATVTALTAICALVGVSLQLRATDAIARAQSARQAYATHLTLAVAHPTFAAPTDACALLRSDRAASYSAFVDHLLYAAEQMLAVEDGWGATFEAALAPHGAYICLPDGAWGDTPETQALLDVFRVRHCSTQTTCPPLE